MKRAIMAVVMLVGWICVSTASGVTTTYEFLPEQSSMFRSGGPRGSHETYSIAGQFQLTVDLDGGIASFDQVDATLSNGIRLGELFNMTELFGTVVSDALISFEGQTTDFPLFDINIILTFMDESVQLTGGFVESVPDGWTYELDAVAVPEPATFLLLCMGMLIMTAELSFFRGCFERKGGIETW